MRRSIVNKVLLLTSAYLILGMTNHSLIEKRFKTKLNELGMKYTAVNVSPTIFNIFYWKLVYNVDGKLYGRHYSVFDDIKIKDFSLLSQSSAVLPNHFF